MVDDNTTNTNRPVALVAGGPSVGKHTLVRALLEAHDQAALPKSEARGRYDLTLDTKYYTADVSLRTLRIGGGGDNEGDTATATATTTTTTAPPAPEKAEALLLAFDASDPASFASIRAWASEGGPGVALAEAAQVRLVVACKADVAAASAANAVAPGWLEDALDWCAAECFEYVRTAAGAGREVDAALRGVGGVVAAAEGQDDEEHEEQQADGGSGGDPHGVPRVKEALEAHLWPGHARKERRRDQGVGTPAGRPLLSRGAEEEEDDAARRDAAALASLLFRGGGGGTGTGTDAATEGDVDAAEALFAEMAAARERLSRLPDAERREAAAELAMRFAAALGCGGDEDDEEEEDDDGA
jgi:hypothetical protein